MTNCERAIENLKHKEKFISISNDDIVYYGISKKKWPNWEGWQFVEKKKYEEANNLVKDFYENNIWIPLGCNKIVNFSVTFNCFQSATKRNVKDVIIDMQRTCNVFDKNIALTGIINSSTIRAINSIDEVAFNKVFSAFQLCYFINNIESIGNENSRKWIIDQFSIESLE
jgi:lysozyme family protein